MNIELLKTYAYRYNAVDWAVAVALYICVLIMNTAGVPYCKAFEWTDPTINYAMREDTFPGYSLSVMLLGLPTFYVLFSRYCVGPLRGVLGEPLSFLAPENLDGEHDAVVDGARGAGATSAATHSDLHNGDGAGTSPAAAARVRSFKCGTGPVYIWVRAHFFSFALEMFIVDMLKLYAGRLRPDFLDRMRKVGYTATKAGLPDPHEDPQFYCNLMSTHRILREGRLSFPSGHSSIAFAIFTVMTFYLIAHLRPFSRQGSFTRLMISLTPMLVPLLCAVSRTRDNRHHFSDIIAGSVIGFVAALVVCASIFRSAGGPLTVYLARSESDIEYVKLQQCLATATANGHGSAFGPLSTWRGGSEYQSTAATEMRYTPNAAAAIDDGTGAVAVPMGNGDSRPASPRGSAAGSPRTFGPTVIVVACASERELNEDSAAVPWI